MARIVILLAVLAVALLVWHKISNARDEERKKLVAWSIIGSIIAVLFVLAATGKLNVITAAISAVVAMIPRLLGYLKYLPLISRLYQQTKAGKQSNGQQSSNRQSSTPPPRKGAMTKQEALAVLGLKPGASREEILSAHKRMMQKVHPDRGGSDHLAMEINKARDTLLG